jgi:hypothetical protein
MSDYTAVRAVSLALQALLKATITNSTDPQLNGVDITLFSPKVMRDKHKDGISLWLYRVNREPDTLNREPERISPTRLRHLPVPLTLHYLITPMRPDPEDEQALLGKVVQVMNDNAVMRGAQVGTVLAADDTELRLVIDGLSLEELARVWDVLKEPYQLSICYVVQIVAIDSDLDVAVRPPVLVGEERIYQIVGEGAA